MPGLTYLPLKTAKGRPMVHKFKRQPEGAAGLLVTFPGNNYGVDGPLLYYPSELLWAAGWDTLALTFGFQSDMTPFSFEVVPEVIEESRLAVETVLAEDRYPRVGLVGKSLGALVVVHLCSVVAELADARDVYLTPPIGNAFFDQPFIEGRQRAYLAMGTADRFYDPEAIKRLRSERDFTLTVIAGADHSLDVPDDFEASIEAVRRVTGDVVRFLQAG